MKATVTALALAAALISVGCGEGRVILNVDVLSFLGPADSVRPYNVPGGVPTVDSTFSRQFSLPPGFGNSSVDEVAATAAAVLENTAGGGDVTFEVFFAKTQGALFSGTPYVTAASGPVSGVQTVQLLPPTTVALSDTVFNASDLWVGIRARISTNAGPNMVGQLRLTQIGLQIVLQDKIL